MFIEGLETFVEIALEIECPGLAVLPAHVDILVSVKIFVFVLILVQRVHF